MLLPVVLADAGSTPSVYYAFQNSDAMGKFIVYLLLGISAFTWAVMLEKGRSLWRSKRLSEQFMRRFKDNEGRSLTRLANETNGSHVSNVYAEGIERLLAFYEDAMPGASRAAELFTRQGVPRAPVKLTGAQFNAIGSELENAVSSQILQLETWTGYLGTIVSISPFLGLFGTVWGVMKAFCGIAMAGKADFTALAPGVAGALLTTVAGLFVAIPALVGYNLINGSIRSQTVLMDNFSEEFMARLKLEQISADEKTPVQE